MSARTILKHIYENGGMTEYQYERIDRVLKERERPHGEWKKKPEISYDYFYCSECEYAYKHAFNFCPNCGSDMRETGDELSNMKYYVCCPMCDKEKCVRGTEECDAEKWLKEREEE